MIAIFIVVCLIVSFLVFLMFLILKKTVGIVNDQTKSYFVNKLQSYDDLIQDKEAKLQKIDDLIKDREKGIKEELQKDDNQKYAFDTDVLDILSSTKYQDQNIFELNKKIDENFVVNYEELVKDFLTLCDDSSNYDFCLKLRDKFDKNIIYDLKVMLPQDREKKLREILNNKEYKVYEAYKLMSINVDNIDGFVDYLDQLVDLNNPKVKILVGNKSENYDHLSEYIETIYSDKIYRGIKIIYKNKVYDFSLSERNV